jgi:hypothetical protein
MRNFYKAFLAVILLPTLTYAQSNYKPGYVVNLKGDTIRGYINNKDWDSNPRTISFKKIVTDNNTQKFTTNDIGFFTVEGVSYQKYTGPISTDGTSIDKLSEGRDTSYRIDTVFLQILQKEKNVALYSYSDNIKSHFFISENPDFKPVELMYRIYYGNADVAGNGNRTVYENTFLKQLFALANKYHVLDDELTSVIQKAGYNKGDIMAIVSRINNISKADYENKYTEHTSSDFYIGAAINIFSASPKPVARAYGYPSSTSVLPAFSVGINLIPRPKSDKVEFRAEMAFAESSYNSVNLSTISFVPQGIYNFYHSQDLKIYLGFGFLLTYNLYSNLSAFNGVNDSFMFKAGAKFNNRWEVFANTLTFPSGEFVHDSSLKAFNEQIGLIYHFNF